MKGFLLMLTLIVIAGCTTHTQLGDSSKPQPQTANEVIPLEGDGRFPAVLQGRVQIFYHEKLLENVTYVPVAGIQITGRRHEVNRQDLIEKMREIAATRGADALYVDRFHESVDEAKLQSLRETRPSSETAKALANIFTSIFGVKSRDEQIRDAYLLTGAGIAIRITGRKEASHPNQPDEPAIDRANVNQPL